MTLQEPHSASDWSNVALHMWRNGGRPLLIAVICFAAAIVVLLAAFLLVKLRTTEEQMPVRFLVPIQITSAATAFKAGERIEFRRTRCNDSEHPETITSGSYYRRLDLIAPAFSVPPSGDSVVTAKGKDNPDGCETTRLVLMLPDDLPPGTWDYEGQACLRRDPKLCTSWKTEQFSVAP